jgi:hypothetical protein
MSNHPINLEQTADVQRVLQEASAEAEKHNAVGVVVLLQLPGG